MHLLTAFALLGFWPFVQLIACLAIIVRLLTFRRGVSRHRLFYAWMAWLYVVVCTATAVKILCGMKPPPGPAEAILTMIAAILLLVHGGNIAHLMRWPREWLARRHRGRLS